jgi:hypothetical protein
MGPACVELQQRTCASMISGPVAAAAMLPHMMYQAAQQVAHTSLARPCPHMCSGWLSGKALV